MTKAKTAADKAADTATSAMNNGAEALKAGFDKALKNYDLVLGYGKETAEACMKSATVAGKGAETLNGEVYAYSKQSLEDSITATKAIMGSKSLHEAFELHDSLDAVQRVVRSDDLKEGARAFSEKRKPRWTGR